MHILPVSLFNTNVARFGSTELATRVSLKLPNQIIHPDEAFRDSADPRHSAFNLAFNTDKPLMGEDGWVASHPQETADFGAASVLLPPP